MNKKHGNYNTTGKQQGQKTPVPPAIKNKAGDNNK